MIRTINCAPCCMATIAFFGIAFVVLSPAFVGTHANEKCNVPTTNFCMLLYAKVIILSHGHKNGYFIDTQSNF